MRYLPIQGVCQEEEVMTELIQYDDDPAATAADAWLRTPVGRKTTEKAALQPREMLAKAFRTGMLIGQKQNANDSRGRDDPCLGEAGPCIRFPDCGDYKNSKDKP